MLSDGIVSILEWFPIYSVKKIHLLSLQPVPLWKRTNAAMKYLFRLPVWQSVISPLEKVGPSSASDHYT